MKAIATPKRQKIEKYVIDVNKYMAVLTDKGFVLIDHFGHPAPLRVIKQIAANYTRGVDFGEAE